MTEDNLILARLEALRIAQEKTISQQLSTQNFWKLVAELQAFILDGTVPTNEKAS
ncbi:hypothetical protein EVB91_006 [Rhizobium phage RHph_I1_18]|nr:hypothetical protein EVB91_006 [Rhizobium phage RHph_I1_18]